jgi:hypothetical protein
MSVSRGMGESRRKVDDKNAWSEGRGREYGREATTEGSESAKEPRTSKKHMYKNIQKIFHIKNETSKLISPVTRLRPVNPSTVSRPLLAYVGK